ncbi:MAG: alkane 1-monooxygenase, partial [Litoreibacter sp.]|nr:alkane 1-monooxygenase [Litoreibacter sp.]
MKNLPANLANALPFWLTLGLVPIAVLAAAKGGWWLALIPMSSWGLFSVLDRIIGTSDENADPDTPDQHLFWHRAITILWFPIQFVLIFGLLAYAMRAPHLDGSERFWLFFGVGVISGTVGIVYSHELMHQKNNLERWLADLLLASVLYSHFRSEHLLVHHRYVATPRDAVTARYNEGFHQFFPRVLRESLPSAWNAEKAMLARKGLSAFDLSNPFARYAALQGGMLLLALLIAGWTGIGLFCLQAFIAVWQLELVNYIEHYGLTRKHLGNGKYERVKPRHSWNATQKASNWLLINLQRHSDH